MLILLPPSESKRDGGSANSRLRLSTLGYPTLSAPRRQALKSLSALAKDFDEMGRALRLGPHQHDELVRNRRVARSPVLGALHRYTGVLYEALDASSLPEPARRFAAQHLVIHSALFGLVRADDPIPAYRLSSTSRLPGLSLRTLWSAPIEAALVNQPGLILDARSESYTRLGPAPAGRSLFLRVVSEDGQGRRKALNHFNKKGKGTFVRALLRAGIDHADAHSLLSWAADVGIALSAPVPGELELVV
ncbi:peroxide stress protein YaaA [Parafrigoribacterium mesophilum]|uniref:YaaA family protein n=1 Tax=Parafrigoribacterium mesophilum TaxID=433646 RepID=UPI0031FD583B